MSKQTELGITLPITKGFESMILEELKRQGFEIKYEEVEFVLGKKNILHVEIGLGHEDIREVLSRDFKSFDLSNRTIGELEKQQKAKNLNDLLCYSETGLREILKLSKASIEELKVLLSPGYVLKFED